MKATGIVRRIDDLGRVVIPKEIRRTLHIRDGDPLEIYTDKDGEVIFKKYSPVGELSDFAARICESLFKVGEAAAAVCDRDSVIACSGAAKKECMEKRVSGALTNILEARRLYISDGSGCLPFIEEGEQLCLSVAAPIISEGDVMGGVVFLAKPSAPPPTEVQIKLAAAVAGFLGRQMET